MRFSKRNFLAKKVLFLVDRLEKLGYFLFQHLITLILPNIATYNITCEMGLRLRIRRRVTIAATREAIFPLHISQPPAPHLTHVLPLLRQRLPLRPRQHQVHFLKVSTENKEFVFGCCFFFFFFSHIKHPMG